MRAYKFRIYPSKTQEKEMMHHLWIAKNLWNELLFHAKQTYANYGRFPTRNSLQIMVKKSGLYSQTQQEIAHRIEMAIWRYCRLKRECKKAGFPRFKSFDRMKSVVYSQKDFWLDKKLEVIPFGAIAIVKHRNVSGVIKTLSLKRESSGRWFAIFSVEEPKGLKATNDGPSIGIDLGLRTFATLSDGTRIANPRHIRRYEEELSFRQRKVWRKKRRSRNRKKAIIRLARTYERLKNSRKDFLHKITRKMAATYSMIALENLACQEMAEQRFGKHINDAGWDTFADMLCYKAENAGCKVVFVNPKETTKKCSNCGKIQDMPLSARSYQCSGCGMLKDRDLNAAENILARATAGHAGSNACGEEREGMPLNETRNREQDSRCATTSLSHEKLEPAERI